MTASPISTLAQGSTTPNIHAGIPGDLEAGWNLLREKEIVVYDAPKEFDDHINLITRLADRIEDPDVRVQMLDAIEHLVQGMNGPWHGAAVTWMYGGVPDDLASLFDEEGM